MGFLSGFSKVGFLENYGPREKFYSDAFGSSGLLVKFTRVHNRNTYMSSQMDFRFDLSCFIE